MLWAAEGPPWANPAPRHSLVTPESSAGWGGALRTAGQSVSVPWTEHRRQGPDWPVPSDQEGPVPAPLDVGEGGAESLPENRACPWPAQPPLELHPALQTGVPSHLPSPTRGPPKGWGGHNLGPPAKGTERCVGDTCMTPLPRCAPCLDPPESSVPHTSPLSPYPCPSRGSPSAAGDRVVP